MENPNFQGMNEPQPKKSNTWLIVGIVAGVLVLCCCVVIIGGYFFVQRTANNVFTSINEQLTALPDTILTSIPDVETQLPKELDATPIPGMNNIESAATQTASSLNPNSKQYSAQPPMTIDVSKQYFATIKLAKGGEFVVQLYPDKAPITVNSFVFLARDGFYNGTTFHRVLEGFMAQGGDPTGTGMGGPGYEFVNEKNDLAFDKAGVVAMANAGPDTNGSQFFIMFGPGVLTEADYTIFGQVISGMDVVNNITRRDPDTNPTFTGDMIESVTIEEK